MHGLAVAPLSRDADSGSIPVCNISKALKKRKRNENY